MTMPRKDSDFVAPLDSNEASEIVGIIKSLSDVKMRLTAEQMARPWTPTLRAIRDIKLALDYLHQARRALNDRRPLAAKVAKPADDMTDEELDAAIIEAGNDLVKAIEGRRRK